jgi:hypothetical protein
MPQSLRLPSTAERSPKWAGHHIRYLVLKVARLAPQSSRDTEQVATGTTDGGLAECESAFGWVDKPRLRGELDLVCP